MIFWTWRSYFIRWQIFENKVWCPVSKKRTKYFHFLLSLAYPIDRLDWALFSVVILFHHFFPLLEKVEIRVFILPRNFPAVLIIFTGRGGEPPLPCGEGSPRDGASIPDCVRNMYISQMIVILNEFMLWCELTSSPWALASVFGMSIIRLSSPAPLPEIKVLYHISKDVMYWASTYINDIVFNSEHIVDGLEWGDGGVAGLVNLRCLVDNSNLPELRGTFE